MPLVNKKRTLYFSIKLLLLNEKVELQRCEMFKFPIILYYDKQIAFPSKVIAIDLQSLYSRDVVNSQRFNFNFITIFNLKFPDELVVASVSQSLYVKFL